MLDNREEVNNVVVDEGGLEVEVEVLGLHLNSNLLADGSQVSNVVGRDGCITSINKQ